MPNIFKLTLVPTDDRSEPRDIAFLLHLAAEQIEAANSPDQWDIPDGHVYLPDNERRFGTWSFIADATSRIEDENLAADVKADIESAYGAPETCSICGRPDNCGDCTHDEDSAEDQAIRAMLERGYSASELCKGMDGYQFTSGTLNQAITRIEAVPTATSLQDVLEAENHSAE